MYVKLYCTNYFTTLTVLNPDLELLQDITLVFYKSINKKNIIKLFF